ncbi:MAG: modification methylase [Anaerolineae bacterium]|nr:modification methylase [Anaerolineae bacterium]
MRQLALLPEVIKEQQDLTRDTFSHRSVCPEEARLELETRYRHLLTETDEFNRKLVSFQANKTEVLHSWMKYREGFSASLVEILLDKFAIGPGDTILDPFAGSGTTLLVAQMMGLNATGIEILPHSVLAWKVKSRAFNYDTDELRTLRTWIREIPPPSTSDTFPHLTITQSAFPEQTEHDLLAYRHWLMTLPLSENARLLCQLILISILESISYTRKDGQYLRWDSRAEKVQERNATRLAKGRQPIQAIYKGDLPSVKEALLQTLSKIIVDITELQRESILDSQQTLIEGSTLYELPKLPANQFAGVITSPPYANRYDYTRTYALELAYMNIGKDIFNLRQCQLSCTVENKPKLEQLNEFYRSIDHPERYKHVVNIVKNNAALAEINTALYIRNKHGDINNQGVLAMIDQYFTELTFVFAELYRTCRPNAYVAFVNDNVRYAGEVIPVDLLCTHLAEQVGFKPIKVYVLPQRKGNSSQQMGKFGREALRKSITIWRKP